LIKALESKKDFSIDILKEKFKHRKPSSGKKEKIDWENGWNGHYQRLSSTEWSTIFWKPKKDAKKKKMEREEKKEEGKAAGHPVLPLPKG
jgi:hypothetical protein